VSETWPQYALFDAERPSKAWFTVKRVYPHRLHLRREAVSNQNEKRDKKTGRVLPGSQLALKHGIYSLDKIPSIRGARALSKHLDWIKVELENAIPDMDVRKELLINQVVKLEQKICLADMWMRKAGIIRRDKLKEGYLEMHPILAASYVALMNSQRLALRDLGIEGEKASRILTPTQLAAKVDRIDAEKKGRRKKHTDIDEF